MCGLSWLAVCLVVYLDCVGLFGCVLFTRFSMYVFSPCAAVRPEKKDREFN